MRARNWTISSLHCANMSPSWPIIGALRHPPHWSTLATFFTHLPACSSACLRANLSAIADWCAATYVTPGDDHAVTIERIREYMKDALSTVAQQVSSSGQALAGCLEQQALELQSMDATMRLVENRLASQKEQLARSAMLGQFMRKLPVPRVNAGAIREPVKESSVYRNAEGRIDFSSLDSIGRGVPEGIRELACLPFRKPRPRHQLEEEDFQHRRHPCRLQPRTRQPRRRDRLLLLLSHAARSIRWLCHGQGARVWHHMSRVDKRCTLIVLSVRGGGLGATACPNGAVDAPAGP